MFSLKAKGNEESEATLLPGQGLRIWPQDSQQAMSTGNEPKDGIVFDYSNVYFTARRRENGSTSMGSLRRKDIFLIKYVRRKIAYAWPDDE